MNVNQTTWTGNYEKQLGGPSRGPSKNLGGPWPTQAPLRIATAACLDKNWPNAYEAKLPKDIVRTVPKKTGYNAKYGFFFHGGAIAACGSCSRLKVRPLLHKCAVATPCHGTSCFRKRCSVNNPTGLFNGMIGAVPIMRSKKRSNPTRIGGRSRNYAPHSGLR